MKPDLLTKRLSGILCHPTSLPGDFGIGDLGPNAYKFIDFLSSSKQALWQVLPLGPTYNGQYQDYFSPYGTLSAFAGNTLLISPEKLWKDGLLNKNSLNHLKKTLRSPNGKRVNFETVSKLKDLMLQEAFAKSKQVFTNNQINRFKFKNDWVIDFATFMALKKTIAKPRDQWDLELRCKNENVLRSKLSELNELIEFEVFCQFLFFKQWGELKDYANNKGVYLIGDVPIYVPNDSADVWAYSQYFSLDKKTTSPRQISGVPPDRYNSTGQLWGHPVFDWQAIEKDGFAWWIARIKANLSLVDIVRIDHFRGFSQFWAVPGGSKTAQFGKWYDCPGQHFFDKLKKELASLPIVIEDLGFITPDVLELRERYNFMGMKVLQFGFDEPSLRRNPYIPFNYTENSVVYSSTHDSPTSLEWFNGLNEKYKRRVSAYLGDPSKREFTKEFLRLAFSSSARFCITPIQDILNLGKEGRMNVPGVHDSKNWGWRMSAIPDHSKSYLKAFTEIYQRTDINN